MEIKLFRPHSLEEALSQRAEYGRDALPIAGGQSLLVMLRNKLIDPKVLLDLEPLGELRDLQPRADGISIGAMTTFFDLISSADVHKASPILAEAAAKVGSTAIRNLGTIGGNLCHNEPGADLPPALLALDASVELRSRKGTRKVPLTEFFQGYFETAVEADEILSRVDIPTLPQGACGAYIKHSISPEDLAIAGVAVVLVPDGKNPVSARELRIGLGGVSPVPLRALKAEAALNGRALTDDAIRAAAEIAASEAEPMSDPHSSADYRRKMIKVLVRRALAAAIGGGERNGHGKA
ncbi:MAG TPA: xanthine dehydrogenase family protein subunit M [Candidatus Eisenbacteria bacterium]|nr:xanthine dehydrogenase family protein subunit M [Candidatus Eisenbacteria bacterium]